MKISLSSKELAQIPAAQKKEIEEALQVINRDSHQTSVADWESYQKAWEKFVSKAPAGLPRLLTAIDKTSPKTKEREILFKVLGEHEDEFLLYATSPPPLSVAPEGLVKILTDYARLHPQTNLKHTLLAITPLFAGAKQCFSGVKYDFPKQDVPFLYSALANRERGREYLPLIEASLKAGHCKPDEIVQILKDLAFVGGLKSQELMNEIVQKHWDDSKEFAQAFLDLANLYPFQPPRQKYMLSAIQNLIPAHVKTVVLEKEDENRITLTLGQIMLGQDSLEKKQAILQSLSKARPAYRDKFHELAGLLAKF